MIYIGVDPGKNGGIAIIDSDGVIAFPFSEERLLIELDGIAQQYECICYLEHVHAMPKQGVSSTFNFGMNFGFIQGVLKAYSIPYELVTPQKWKKEFSCTSEKNTSTEVWKRLSPKVNLKAPERRRRVHDGMAAASLLAEYGRSPYNGRE